MAGELTGKTAIVTGASTGIGRGIVAALAAAGANIALFARSKQQLEEVAGEARRHSVKVLAYPGDVSDRAAVKEVVRLTREQLGVPNILVNNAGTNTPKRGVSETSDEDWDRIVAVNLTGAYSFVREVLPHMKADGGGLVVNIVSLAGKAASKLSGAAYSASKFGMAGLTGSINDEEHQHGIRATSIYPGDVETPILDRRPAPPSPEQRAYFLQPDDLAAAVLFVAALPPRACVTEIIIRPTRTLEEVLSL